MEERHTKNECEPQDHKLLLGVMAVSTAALAGIMGFGIYKSISQESKSNAHVESELINAMKADGFTPEQLDYNLHFDRRLVQLNLGSCSLQEVTFTFTKQDKRIINVHDYRFVQEGIEFKFESLNDITQLFGNDPCVTFARTTTPLGVSVPVS